jgi:glycosyltransferase involved in cell wall biosynthesis
VRPNYLVENAVDPALFSAVGAERTIDILGVGSFEPLKQYDVFTEVVRSVQAQINDVRAAHCGIGREQEKIQSLIKQFRLEKNFHLLGGKPHEEILKLMQQTKIFLHPSRYEGFSTVCLEALYAGCHVVSFLKPVEKEVKHWHIVKTQQEMVEKCLHLLGSRDLDFERVLLYSMDDSARKVMNLFN